MNTKIFYYTGTGNSLWVTKEIARRIDNSDIFSISKISPRDFAETDFDAVGFIFPVYIWGVPAPILNFISSLTKFSPDYCFAIATNGGQVANTLVQLQKFLHSKNVELNSAFEIKTPSNYIPWGSPVAESAQKILFHNATEKIIKIAEVIKNKKKLPVEKGPLWTRIIFSIFYKISYKHIHSMDEKFWVDEKCNGCKICEKICPANNILMINGRPAWNHKCHQCFACLQWCPQEAIQYGKKTPKYKRYHHPDIELKEIL